MPGPPGYMPYPNTGYVRSPPAMQHFVPLQQSYGRPPQHSPIVSSPYHPPPPAAAPIVPPLPHTPSSTHSHAMPPPMTPPAVQQLHESAQLPVPITVQLPPQPTPQHEPQLGSRPVSQQEAHLPQQISEPIAKLSPTTSLSPPKEPFRPPVCFGGAGFCPMCIQDSLTPIQLPWLSQPDLPFPQRLSKLRMRRKLLGADSERVELPEQHAPGAEAVTQNDESQDSAEVSQHVAVDPAKAEAPVPHSSTQDQLPETAASSTVAASSSAQPPTVTPTAVKPAVPAVPVVPALPKASPKETKATASVEAAAETKPAVATSAEQQAESAKPPTESVDGAAAAAPPVPAWTKPKLWTGLFSKPNGAVASTSSAATDTQAETNGSTAEGPAAMPGAGSFAKANASSLAQALQAYRPSAPDRLAFLEPRGLVNTGNMCYMNSVRTSRSSPAGSFLTL